MKVSLTREEQAKSDFIDALMAYNSVGISPRVKQRFAARAKRTNDPIDSIEAVAGLLADEPTYKFLAFFERHNHAMVFQTTLDVLNARRDEVLGWLDDSNRPGSLGSLELNPSVQTPPYYRRVEIHTQPGSYHGSPFAGILYHWMIGPFLVHRDDDDGMAWALANAVPKKDYCKILDLGCGIGKSTFPYCDLYPQAEVVGIDYAAPMLKYGHKWAEERGSPPQRPGQAPERGKGVHFSQRLAEDTGYPDESFDLITALWLFHEIPNKIADAVCREAYRLLKPGGVFALMEGPPYRELIDNHSPLSAFMLDSSGKRMSDPFLPGFFRRDRAQMLKGGGFQKSYDRPVDRQLAAEEEGTKNFFGPYPWWVTMGEKL